MTPKQITKLAKDTLKAGPVIHHDEKGNGYFAYVILVREGYKYAVVIIDEEIASLNGRTQEFLECEIRAFLEGFKEMPLSKTFVDDLSVVPL